MTAACGCRRKRAKRALQTISRKTSATTIWRTATQALAIWCPATSRHETLKKCVMKGVASGRTDRVSIWISRMPFTGSVWKPFARNTATSSKFINGKRSPDSIHKELGRIMWDDCGMARSDAGLKKALARTPELRDEFWHNLRIVGGDDELNQALEKANRISDFLELAELMCLDALERTE